jgi:cytoskeletal protein CcmA (bactofilin family)
VPPLPDLPSPGQQNAASAPQVAAAAASAPVATPSPARGASVLARDLVFEGNISGDGELTIDGQVKGDVRVNRLIVGDTGSVEGTVQADNVDVKGRVVGAVQGKNVKLLSTAYVDGDINHEQLAIEVGAYFQGRCLQTRPGQACRDNSGQCAGRHPGGRPCCTRRDAGHGRRGPGRSGQPQAHHLIRCDQSR